MALSDGVTDGTPPVNKVRALVEAAARGDIPVVTQLLSDGVDINSFWYCSTPSC
jgi:hypothetical protein